MILILCMVQQQLIGICSILSHLDHLLPTSPGFGQSWLVEPDPIGSRCPITSSISRDHICSNNNKWSTSQGEQAVQYGRMEYALHPLVLLRPTTITQLISRLLRLRDITSHLHSGRNIGRMAYTLHPLVLLRPTTITQIISRLLR